MFLHENNNPKPFGKHDVLFCTIESNVDSVKKEANSFSTFAVNFDKNTVLRSHFTYFTIDYVNF